MLGVADEEEWEFVGRAIERELKSLGWSRCWTKPSSVDGSAMQFAARRDLLYCVRLEPAYMMLDVTSYITGTPEPHVFVHRVCGPAVADSPKYPAISAGPGCAVPENVGPLRHGGGVLAKSAIHPLGRCRAQSISVPCPHRPLETIRAMVHSGLDPGCIALPDARGREPEDQWTKRLATEGLRADDVRILRERSKRLDELGFQSMTPFFENCSNLADVLALT
eukprot:TRINITY_DN49350_c0_g1_i1.p1 TRINITY_DN49350_c0_g1~~TRINITY_DN49350_c0_g1_i1.p1  ORF type:complete len:222 (+),score=41.63 TRINITY_DN49350_c0_g1_i1:181-846(+)